MLPDHDTMVLNVLAHYARATADERARGCSWYPSAYAEAEAIAADYIIAPETAAAVIAALSPQTEWGHNLRWAREVVHAYYNGDALPRRGLGNNLVRARRALDGNVSDILREEGTLKVRNFYGSIIGERGSVCIDRHALRIALGDSSISITPGLTDKRYRQVAEAYRDAARELGKGARTVQAITWVVCKRERGEA